jgi:serralysin
LTSSTPTVDFGDTPSTAGSVTVGGTVTGTLTHVQQRDWFGVTLTAGTQYTFSTSGGTLGSNATVALYDANGNNLVSQISGGTTNGAERSFTPTTTGTYYVEAGALLGATGTFNVSVTAIGTEADAGNINTQGVISTASPATGTLTTPGDSNWFKATLAAGTTYAFKMTDGTLSGAQIGLYDSTGKLITTYGASGSGNAEIVFTAPAAGTYYIAAAGQLANTGSYTITESIVTPDVAVRSAEPWPHPARTTGTR